MSVVGWLTFLLGSLFVLGCAVGSFLNVCIYRMATRRSISWPGSHCGACVRPIPGWHNVPLFTYLILGGRCAMCGARFSARYFLVELLTGVVFAGLFAAEVGWNWQRVWQYAGWEALKWGQFPPDVVPYYLAHAFLACLLIVAAGTLADGAEVPPAVVVAGAAAGFAFAAAYPALLLATGPAVFAVGLVPALVRLTGRDRAAADVALLAGGFLGWQPVALALMAAALVPGGRLGLRLALLVPVVWLGWPLREWLLHPAALVALLMAVLWASRR
ncbi:MAG: prepilin peptidase [Gemmataceae bacterium]